MSLLFSNSGLNHISAHFIPAVTLLVLCRGGLETDGLILWRSNSAIKWPEYEQSLVLFQSCPILVLIMMLRLPEQLWTSFGTAGCRHWICLSFSGSMLDTEDC